MNRTTNRIRISGALAILLLGAGCGDRAGDTAARATGGEPEMGGTAIIVEGADMTQPLSMLAQGTIDGYLGEDVLFMGLLRGDWDEALGWLGKLEAATAP